MRLTTERERVAHLLRRFGFGASEAELDYYGANSLDGAIDKLLNYESVAPNVDFDPQAFANGKGTVNVRVMQALWYLRLIGTNRPLEEKMTFFWHNHFATSAQKVELSFVMARQIALLREHATGKFSDLLTSVSKDPAMVYWLDGQDNVKGNPNENLAREVLELFTLGIGNYTEDDVKEAARAFTGWTYSSRQNPSGALSGDPSPRRRDRFYFAADRHDDGHKTFLGKSGPLSGEEVLEHLSSQRECAQFLTRKVWEWFVYESPDEATLNPIAERFYESKLDIKVLLRSIMESPDFYSDRAARQQFKTPLDFVVASIRQIGAGARAVERVNAALERPTVNSNTGLNMGLIRALAPAFAALTATTSMGLELMYPPDVSGWRPGAYWITTSTMLARTNWCEQLFLGGRPAGRSNLGADLGGTRGPSVAADARYLFQTDSPTDAVDRCLSLLDASHLPPEKRDILVAAANRWSGGRITAANSNEVARSICRLLFATNEFQFC